MTHFASDANGMYAYNDLGHGEVARSKARLGCANLPQRAVRIVGTQQPVIT